MSSQSPQPSSDTIAGKLTAQREDRIRWYTSQCAHFNGTQSKTCKAGVSYAPFRGAPLPCLGNDQTGEPPTTECPDRRWHTREEAEARVRKSEESIERLSVCLKAIHEKHGKARGLTDKMPCPTGCGGTLRYSIAGGNGHVWGRCSSEGCASWMQ